MAIENLPNESGDSHLSGAYIRTLVKQLTTTTTPTSKPCLNTTQNFTINNNDTLSLVPNDDNNNHMTNTTTKKLAMAKTNQKQEQSQGHKKQVRRRLHTSRPYQERLLNMAEARKEIVTALKFHRAAMKQANDRKQQHQQQQQSNNQQQVARGCNNYDNSVKGEQLSVDNFSYYYQPLHNNKNYNQSYYPPSNIISTTTTSMYDTLSNFPLPNQTLGLNLNLQAFTNLDTKFCHNNINNLTTSNATTITTTTTTTSTNSHPSTAATPSSPSTPMSITTTSTTTEAVGPTSGDGNNSMHPCLDEEEIAKMRSIGEQYQIEWDDTLNVVKSAWWFKFLKTVDFGNNKDVKHGYYNNCNDHDISFEDELMEFPPWLSPSNDESFLHQQLDDSCSEDNTTLPWMDIEDIDGMDDEWLS